jgi:hypothetical protein
MLAMYSEIGQVRQGIRRSSEWKYRLRGELVDYQRIYVVDNDRYVGGPKMVLG